MKKSNDEMSKEFEKQLMKAPIKLYYEMDNIGSSKYSVNFTDGTVLKDGSICYGIKLFNNKLKRNAFLKKLLSFGYKYKAY